MPFFSLDLLPLTHFRALKHPIPAMREHFYIPSVIFACTQEGAGKELFAEVCRRDLVAKRKSGVYREDRQDRLKVKNPTYSQAQGRHDLFRR